MESTTPILQLKVRDANITVDEDLQLHWHGAFHLGIAAHSMQLIEDLLCLYGDCQQRQPPLLQGQEGWIEFSTLYHGTRLLQSRLDRLPQSWKPTGKPALDRIINIFCTTTRDSDHETTIYNGRYNGESESLEKHLHNSFQYIEGWHDGPYRSVWLSEELMAQVTYCKGNVSIDVAADAAAYRRLVQSAMQFYTIKEDHWVVIPRSLPVTQAIVNAMSQEWKQIKLTAKGHIIARGFSIDSLWDAAQKWFEENPEGNLKLDAGGGAVWFGKTAFERPEARAEFALYFPSAKKRRVTRPLKRIRR